MNNYILIGPLQYKRGTARSQTGPHKMKEPTSFVPVLLRRGAISELNLQLLEPC